MRERSSEPPTEPIPVRVPQGVTERGIPPRFQVWERWIATVDVLDIWEAEDHRYLKLRGDDGGMYVIRQQIATDAWTLVVYSKIS
jgi:hypothetical protein